ncbi:MAG: aminoglycoside phosphotransferase family protein [Defluviitaleaceae bacterium]|nr:aminoglycoside phosphotransferase family protein [Defluviitaleaceae bacterium]
MSRILSLLATAFPDLIIHSLTRITGGKAGEIYLANNQIIFKVALTADTSYSDLAPEYDVLCALRGKVDVPIPQPLHLGKLSDGRKVLGMSLIPGVQFTQEIYESFSMQEKNALFFQLGEILHQIHSAPVPHIRGISKWNSEENLVDFYKHYNADVKNALTPAEQLRIQKIADDFLTAIKANSVPMVLCHGDLHFWNLHYDPDTKKICGLLDFGIACYNDPLNDIRYFWGDTATKILRGYRGNIGENPTERHLFYNICNLIEEARGELSNGEAGFYVDNLKKAMFQEPLRGC